MELEFYDEEKHDFFLDHFKKHAEEPDKEEKEFFKREINTIVGEVSKVTGISSEFKLYFAKTDTEKLGEELPINRYIHGYSFAKWMKGFDRDVIMIRAVKDRENWHGCLVNMIAHEMAHQEFYKKNSSSPEKVIDNIILEGHAMNRANKAAEKLEIQWSPHYRNKDSLNIDSQTIIDILDQNRRMDEKSIFRNGEEPCSNAEGYTISYQVIKHLIENTSLTLENLPSKEDEFLRKRVKGSLRTILN